MIEVLSPAGSLETAIAAIRAGADAIYFGTENFNARRNAKNFTNDDVKALTEHCRIRVIKAYLTLNTLINDSERIEALNVAYKNAQNGIDAIIVQDIGLAKLLKANIPELPLHASTQLSVHSKDGLYLLKEMGFSRVVPAREMNQRALSELCTEAKNLEMEVEAFVHGALCMCVSGQCYLSSTLGGRSGNRGLCAQPCRLPFAVNGGTGNDLSLKDMSYINLIPTLTKMGVSSFKIEGRMKRPEYVATASAAARFAADGLPIPKDIQYALSNVFSRNGHTDGYFTDNLGRNMFGIRTEQDEQLSSKVLTSTHELYRLERQSVGLCGKITIKKDRPITLTVSDGKTRLTKSSIPPEAAINKAITTEWVHEKVSKLGGTCFFFNKLDIELDDKLSVKASVLSDLRKQVIDELTKKRSEKKPIEAKPSFENLTGNRIQKTQKTAVVASFRSISQIPENLDGIDAVILPLKTDFSAVKYLNLPIIADIPRGVMNTEKIIAEQLKLAEANGVKAAICNNVAAYKYLKQTKISPIAGFGMNLYNSDSVSAAKDFGSKAAIASFELSLNETVNLGGDIPIGIISYGRLPLMLLRNCPNKNGNGCKDCEGEFNITDRKNIAFKVMCRNGFSEMYNSRPVWMLDRQREFSALEFQVLLFTDETKEQCADIINSALKGLQANTEYTRGLYYRKVL